MAVSSVILRSVYRLFPLTQQATHEGSPIDIHATSTDVAAR